MYSVARDISSCCFSPLSPLSHPELMTSTKDSFEFNMVLYDFLGFLMTSKSPKSLIRFLKVPKVSIVFIRMIRVFSIP